MNVPDQHRCQWATAGARGLRCMCPATMSTSKFCIFHRHADQVDVHGIVEWSQEATAEEYVERAKAFLYARPSPEVERLRAMLKAHHGGARPGIASSRLFRYRQPGDDEELAA